MEKIIINGKEYIKRSFKDRILAHTMFRIPAILVGIFLILFITIIPEQYYLFHTFGLTLIIGVLGSWVFEISFYNPKTYLLFRIFSNVIAIIVLSLLLYSIYHYTLHKIEFEHELYNNITRNTLGILLVNFCLIILILLVLKILLDFIIISFSFNTAEAKIIDIIMYEKFLPNINIIYEFEILGQKYQGKSALVDYIFEQTALSERKLNILYSKKNPNYNCIFNYK